MSKSEQRLTCPCCAGKLPRAARFCPACGGRLPAGDTLVLPPEAPVGFPPSVDLESVGAAGRTLLPQLGALGALALVIAIVLFAAGAWIGGMILLGLSLASITLFLSGVRRQPDSHLARVTLAARDRARSLARLTAVSARAWSGATPDLLKIRRRQRRLRHELRHRLAPLGEAVCHDDQRRAEALKAQASELEHALRETERQASAALAGARRQIERERATSQSTQPLPARQAHTRVQEDGRSGKPGRDRRAAQPRA